MSTIIKCCSWWQTFHQHKCTAMKSGSVIYCYVDSPLCIKHGCTKEIGGCNCKEAEEEKPSIHYDGYHGNVYKEDS